MINKIEKQRKLNKQRKINKMKNEKMEIQKGSGFFAKLFGLENNKSDGKNMNKLGNITKARKTETMFINSWKNLQNASKKLKHNYENHLKSLEELDNKYNIKGISTSFKSIIIPNDFNNQEIIDKKNPLLLRNYLVSNNALPRIARKEHLLALARYVIKKFTMGDEILIDNINVVLTGMTAKYKLQMVDSNDYEISVKVDDNYIIDINKFQKELIKIFKKMKKMMLFDIEVVEDFKLGEEPIQIPGLDFLDQDEGIEKKLLGLQSSVKGEDDSIVAISQKDGNSSMIDKDMLFSLPKLESEKDDRFAKELSIGIDQGLDNVRQLDKKPADVEEKLAKIMEGGPEGLLKVSSEDSSSNTSGKDNRRKGSKRDSYRRKLSSKKKVLSEKRSKKKEYSVKKEFKGNNKKNSKPKDPKQEKIDKMNKVCFEFSDDKNKCNKTIGCFFNAKKGICHINKNALED